jgi:glycogen debranching enzyme
MGKSIIQKNPTQAKDISGALVIREKNLSLVTLRGSDIPMENNNGYGLYYRDCLENFNEFEVSPDFSFQFEADFADIFTIRGARQGIDGKALPPSYEQGTLTFTYPGKDHRKRETRISFKPGPTSVDATTCHFSINLKPHSYQRIFITIGVYDQAPGEPADPESSSPEKRLKGIRASYAETEACCINIWTNNGNFNKAFMKSLADLRML